MIEVLQGIYAGILAFVSFIASIMSAFYSGLLMVADAINLMPLFSIYLPGIFATACGITLAIMLVRFLMLR